MSKWANWCRHAGHPASCKCEYEKPEPAWFAQYKKAGRPNASGWFRADTEQAREVLRLDEENSQLRVEKALLQDLLRGTGMVLVGDAFGGMPAPEVQH